MARPPPTNAAVIHASQHYDSTQHQKLDSMHSITPFCSLTSPYNENQKGQIFVSLLTSSLWELEHSSLSRYSNLSVH